MTTVSLEEGENSHRSVGPEPATALVAIEPAGTPPAAGSAAVLDATGPVTTRCEQSRGAQHPSAGLSGRHWQEEGSCRPQQHSVFSALSASSDNTYCSSSRHCHTHAKRERMMNRVADVVAVVLIIVVGAITVAIW